MKSVARRITRLEARFGPTISWSLLKALHDFQTCHSRVVVGRAGSSNTWDAASFVALVAMADSRKVEGRARGAPVLC